MSKRKGKVGEREVAALFREHGFGAKRGVQYKGGPSSPDVELDDLPVHVEVKRTEQLRLYPAIEQAKMDADWAKVPTVFHRQNGREWLVIMPAADWFNLVKKAYMPFEEDC